MPQRPLNVGLIGGGAGAFIVQPHQRAIFFDGTRRVTCAALHPDPDTALKEAEEWAFPIQGYRSYDELIEGNELNNVLIIGRESIKTLVAEVVAPADGSSNAAPPAEAAPLPPSVTPGDNDTPSPIDKIDLDKLDLGKADATAVRVSEQ